jgi:hypothetical protein
MTRRIFTSIDCFSEHIAGLVATIHPPASSQLPDPPSPYAAATLFYLTQAIFNKEQSDLHYQSRLLRKWIKWQVHLYKRVPFLSLILMVRDIYLFNGLSQIVAQCKLSRIQMYVALSSCSSLMPTSRAISLRTPRLYR